MSNTKVAALHAAETTIGALNELARRGGQEILGGHPSGPMKTGEQLVRGAAKVAPAAVAAASAKTVAVVGAVKVAAVAAAPVAVLGAAGYGIYRLTKWLGEKGAQ